MRFRSRLVRSDSLTLGLLALAPCLFTAGIARAAAFESYGGSYRALPLPATGPGSFGLAGDCLIDGRIVGVTGRSVFLETDVGTGVFSAVAQFDDSVIGAGGAADPAFLRVSPDGQRIAVGMGFGKPVAIVPVSGLGAAGAPSTLSASSPGLRLFNVPHNEGAWRSNGELALTAGNFGSPSRVTLLNTASDPAAPANPTIIAGIGGSSAGVGFDAAGRLFTGNGFDLTSGGGPSTTGTIRAFDPAAWSGGAADFETGGTLIGNVLSASSLLFDHDGNLVISGGDFSEGDAGYVGIISHTALLATLAGGLPIDRNDLAALRRLSPLGDPFAFYGAAYNPLTGEVYATLGDFATGGNTWYATIPAPTTSLLFLGGLICIRRRR
jgi:hypothetical protein